MTDEPLDIGIYTINEKGVVELFGLVVSKKQSTRGADVVQIITYLPIQVAANHFDIDPVSSSGHAHL